METLTRARQIAVAAVSLSLLAALLVTTGAAADARSPTSSKSTFRLSPGAERVDVTVDVTVTNRIPNKVTVAPCPGQPSRTCRTTTRFFTDKFGFFSVQTGGRNVKFSGPGVKARVDHKNDAFTNYLVDFAPIYQGQSRTFRVNYQVPAAGPRSRNATRITDAYAHFCWHGQPTDRGTVTAFLPKTFEQSTDYGAVAQKRSKKGVILKAKRKTNLGRFYACTHSFKPHKMVRTETVSPSGQTVVIEGWPEDPKWTEEITANVVSTLPQLEELAGVPIPGDEIAVRQVAAQALGPYAGEFDDRSESIRVNEDYGDQLVIAHELAHAWFNGRTIKDTWLAEGYADWMAHEANRRACVRPGDYPGKGKPQLGDWQYLGVDFTQREEKVVDYQYEAACDIVQQMEWLVGLERMAEISRALLERTPKYGGTRPKKPPKPDWREWLDAVDELGTAQAGRGLPRTAELLLVKYGVAKPKQLKGRAPARARYHEALDAPWGEYMPVAVRNLMDAWQFDKAMRALGVSESIADLATSAETDGSGQLLGLVGPQLRDARSIGELRRLKMRLATDPVSFEPAEETAPAEETVSA
jgi:hypothetical protein